MTTRQVTFILPAHIANGAETGILLGDFNNWNADRGIPLSKTKDGDFTATVELISGEYYQYRYLLDGKRWENDDRANSYEFSHDSQSVNCVVFVGAAEEYKTEHSDEALPEKKAAKKTPVKKVEPKPVSPGTKKIVTSKEDLSEIEGISKSVASLLNQKGVDTFARLSKSTIKSLKEFLEAEGSKFENINPSDWPKKAKAYIAANAASKKKK